MNPDQPIMNSSTDEDLTEDVLDDSMDGFEEKFEWVVQADAHGTRLDKFIALQLKEKSISRTQVQQVIKEHGANVNGQLETNVKLPLNTGDIVSFVVHHKPSKLLELEPENIPLDVVYEDDDIIVINKPRGMVVHPSAGHERGTLVHALLYHCQSLSTLDTFRPGIVHRLDKDTSGLLMVAKNNHAHLHLSNQLKNYEVERTYLAIVHGHPAHESGTIDAPIGRHDIDRKKFAVTDKNSKRAVTHFKVLERFKDAALLEVQLETGRTHQIRVHMSFIGHPIIGDSLYGRNRRALIEGQALHAHRLVFTHPTTGQKLRFEAPLPAELDQLLHVLRNRS